MQTPITTFYQKLIFFFHFAISIFAKQSNLNESQCHFTSRILLRFEFLNSYLVYSLLCIVLKKSLNHIFRVISAPITSGTTVLNSTFYNHQISFPLSCVFIFFRIFVSFWIAVFEKGVISISWRDNENWYFSLTHVEHLNIPKG